MRPFKRKKIENESHLAWAIWYVHRNPLHHGFTKEWRNWKYSSYKTIVETCQVEQGPCAQAEPDRLIHPASTHLSAKAVLDFFGSVEAFEKFHDVQQQGYYESLE